MFFADHYRKAWFSFWEPRWYGGFNVTSYPPLASQCLALLSYLSSLESAYQLLTFILMVIFPFVIYYFSTIFVSKKSSEYASFLSVFLPSLIMTVYIFGQFTTLFSLELLLASFYFLQKYLDNRDRKYFLLSVFLLTSSISSHHFTAVFFMPFLMLVILVTNVICRGIKVVKYLVLPFLTSLLISTLILWPLWDFLLHESMQKPIPHASRANIFFDENAFFWFFIFMYGPLIVLIPLSILFSKLKKAVLPLLFTAMLFSILGLGGTTPIPAYLFGRLWEWLTYDRFTLWSHIMFLPFIGQLISEVLKKRKNFPIRTLFGIIIIFAAFICSISLLFYESYLPQKVDIDPIVNFLSKDNNWRWRYITLGFGPANLAKLSIYTNASTIDGFYVTGRRDMFLRESGIETLDGAKIWKNGTIVLDTVLQKANLYKLKWVFCNDPFYYGILIKNGFNLISSQESVGNSGFKKVTFWSKDSIPQLGIEEVIVEEKITIFNYLWGIGSLVSLIAALFILLKMALQKIVHSP
ncbi:MAG: 6-pyruvoyl-tetrahydropterin synthase-related protein [Nitrososphaeria archaeon]